MKKLALIIALLACVIALSSCALHPVACTMEAKICPDGSAVGRTGPNCEFTPCPEINNSLKIWTDNDIKIELNRLDKINTVPNNLEINSKDYPKSLGIYSKNNLTLIEKYYCSDVCPQYGGISIVFENVSKEMCGEIKGIILIDPAWGGYKGCTPNISRYI